MKTPPAVLRLNKAMIKWLDCYLVKYTGSCGQCDKELDEAWKEFNKFRGETDHGK